MKFVMIVSLVLSGCGAYQQAQSVMNSTGTATSTQTSTGTNTDTATASSISTSQSTDTSVAASTSPEVNVQVAVTINNSTQTQPSHDTNGFCPPLPEGNKCRYKPMSVESLFSLRVGERFIASLLSKDNLVNNYQLFTVSDNNNEYISTAEQGERRGYIFSIEDVIRSNYNVNELYTDHGLILLFYPPETK